jgi:hypothetical protein
MKGKHTFSSAISKFGKKAVVAADKVRRASIIELTNLIILATPVDTGRLRGNWHTMLNAPYPGASERKDKTGREAMAEVLANLGSLADVVYFVNNLPYVEPIEFDGHSAQAPDGMLRKNVARWKEIVAAKAKGYSDV